MTSRRAPRENNEVMRSAPVINSAASLPPGRPVLAQRRGCPGGSLGGALQQESRGLPDTAQAIGAGFPVGGLDAITSDLSQPMIVREVLPSSSRSVCSDFQHRQVS